MFGECPITVVNAPQDDPGVADLVLGLHDATAGRLAYEVTAGGHRLYWAANDVLTGLGKNVTWPSGQRNGHDRWESAVCWILGDRIRDVFVYPASKVHQKGWRHLVELSALAGLHLWLVIDEPVSQRGRRDLLHDWDVEWISVDEFGGRWSAPEPGSLAGEPAVDDGTRRPPAAEWPLFIAVCRDLLPPADFQRTVDHYIEGAAQAHVAPLDPEDDFAATEHWLRLLVQHCKSAHEVVAMLRGAQQTFCISGGAALLLREEQFYAHGTLDATLDPSTTKTIRQFVATRFAALAALRLLAHLTPGALTQLDLGAISHDGSTLIVGSESWSVPACASGILRAHCLSRRAQGASEHDSLFVHEDARGRIRPANERAIQIQLTRAAQLSGLPVAEHWNSASAKSARSWLWNRGISVQPL